MTNWILTAIYKSIWGVFVSGPLYLVSGFNDVLYYLSGGIVWDLLFGGKKTFSLDTIPFAFWGFCILAAGIVCLMFAIQYIIILCGENKEMKNKLVHTIKMTGFACVFVFFIPIAYFMLNQLINFIASMLSTIFGVKDLNIAGMVWNLGNPDWNGKDVYNGSFFDTPDNILHYNLIAEIFGAWFIAYAVMMLGLALVQKIFELFFLFCTGPVVGATMTIDGGKRMIIWKDYVIAKSLASLGTIIAYYIFMVGIGAIIGGALGGFNGASRQILIILLICGGALSCMGISNIIAAFVGEGVGIREGMASISSTMAALKMTAGTGKVVGKAIGFGKNKKAQLQGGSVNNVNGLDTIQQGAMNFKTENQDPNKIMDAGAFKLTNNGLRSRTGALRVAGTALALASTSVFAFTRGAGKATQGGRFITKVPRAMIGGTAAAVAQPFKAVGKATGRGVKGAGAAFKENTHGVYNAAKEHHKSKPTKKSKKKKS